MVWRDLWGAPPSFLVLVGGGLLVVLFSRLADGFLEHLEGVNIREKDGRP